MPGIKYLKNCLLPWPWRRRIYRIHEAIKKHPVRLYIKGERISAPNPDTDVGKGRILRLEANGWMEYGTYDVHNLGHLTEDIEWIYEQTHES